MEEVGWEWKDDLYHASIMLINSTSLSSLISCCDSLAFTLNFVNGSPKVKGNEVSVDFKSSRPLVSAICFLGRNIVKECMYIIIKFYIALICV